MRKEELSRRCGWAFILGSFSFATILSGSDPLAIPGSVISSILLAIGLSGLRARYGERAGNFGRNMLLLGILGLILWFIVTISMTLLYYSGAITISDAQVSEGLWILIFAGPAIVLLGLTLFGLTALRSKPMPRLNWLPVFAGIWYPAFYFFAAGYLFTNYGKYQYDIAILMITIIALIQFLALCALGAFLVSEATREMATT